MLDKSKYKQINGIYLHNDISGEELISRYLDISKLVYLLKNKKLYLSCRSHFTDLREHGKKKDMRKCFLLMPFGHKKNKKQQWEQCKRKKKEIETSFNYCVSSWTLKKDEDFLMWKAYTNADSGCRISLTINQLMKAIKPPSFDLFISRIKYEKEQHISDVEHAVFCKTPHYQQEEELRICAIVSEKEYVEIDINLESLISNIVLSPFFNNNIFSFYKASLLSSFPFLQGIVYSSEILEFK